MNALDTLRDARSILLVDWPTREVPDTLARAGYEVSCHGGPRPEDYSVYEVEGETVVDRNVGRPPESVDVVYTHRPLDELAEIVEQATSLGARLVWCQTGSAEARGIVEAAGLLYADEPIVDTVRAVREIT